MIGKILKASRALKGLTQEQVAQKLGKSIAVYNRIEKGRRAMTNAEGAILAGLLGPMVRTVMETTENEKSESPS
jgi:transcriptional regulator with XRE-family HTH domain